MFTPWAPARSLTLSPNRNAATITFFHALFPFRFSAHDPMVMGPLHPAGILFSWLAFGVPGPSGPTKPSPSSVTAIPYHFLFFSFSLFLMILIKR